jgi:hypothetical protein
MSNVLGGLLAVCLLTHSGSAQALLYEFVGESARDLFGGSIAAGDFDLDGKLDLVIGAAWDDQLGS